MTRDLQIDRDRAALLIVDIQERLAGVMPPGDRATCEGNVRVLVEMARRLGIPVVVSQQYPKGLGPTTEAVRKALEGQGLHLRQFDKVEFACPMAPDFEPIWNDLRREQWIVTGMETHICVYQTARALVDKGAAVQVVQDAVCSRLPENRQVGLKLIEKAGATVTSTETVLFDALGKAGTDDFKALSRLIK